MGNPGKWISVWASWLWSYLPGLASGIKILVTRLEIRIFYCIRTDTTFNSRTSSCEARKFYYTSVPIHHFTVMYGRTHCVSFYLMLSNWLPVLLVPFHCDIVKFCRFTPMRLNSFMSPRNLHLRNDTWPLRPQINTQCKTNILGDIRGFLTRT